MAFGLSGLTNVCAPAGGEHGGELSDIVEANECSKSDERKSSTSLAASVRMRRSEGLRDGAGGGLRCLEDSVEKNPGILRFCSERLRFLEIVSVQ